MDSGAVGLLAGDLVDVDDELFAVDAHHAARVALVVSASHSHFVIQPKGEVFLYEA